MTAVAVLRRIAPDATIVAAVLGLAAIGWAMLRAATMPVEGSLSSETIRQTSYGAIGLAVLLVSSRLHLDTVRRIAPIIYVASMASLLAVLVLGTEEFGARRWIALGSLTVQPSEFAKIATVVGIAAYATDREPGIRYTLTSLALVTLPMALVLIEPDLGTTLVLGAAWIAMAATWGASWRVLGGLSALVVSVLPIAFAVAVPDYQRERLAVFFQPDRDPLGSGFTMRQVEIALGSGGLTGQGLNGQPSALDGVATRTSDFAFAQLGEQMGLVGATLVLALIAVIAWRGLDAAVHAPDRFGRILAAGLTGTIVLQALMHIAVNTRLFPTTGIPLPFVSTGGSAIVAMCLATGLIMAVASHRGPPLYGLWDTRSAS